MAVSSGDHLDEISESPSIATVADPFVGRARWALAGFFLLTATAGLLSDGVYHEDDLTHYLFARWVGHDWGYLIDEWGRPGFTVPYALPAMVGSRAVGWHACRLLSAGIAASTAWLAYRIARHFRLRHAWLAILLLYLQPLFIHLSLTTLTETPLAFYFALATWLLLKRYPIASAAVIALAPVTRHEAIVVLPIWAIALWRERARWPAYAALCWAILAQNALALFAFGVELLPLWAWTKPNAGSHYGAGTPLTYVPRLLLASGPLIVALAIMGMNRLRTRARAWLIAVVPAVYFAAETAIYLRSAYASGGYARFLVPMAPFIAVLAVAGISPLFLVHRPHVRARTIVATGATLIILWAICEIEWRWRPPNVPDYLHTIATAGRIITACFVAVLGAILLRMYRRETAHLGTFRRLFIMFMTAVCILPLPLLCIVPLRLLPRHHHVRQAAQPLQTRMDAGCPLITANYWVYYWSDRPITCDERLAWAYQPGLGALVARAAPRTLFAWDHQFAAGPDFNVSYQEMLDHPDWRLAWFSPPEHQGEPPFLAVFERGGKVRK